MTKWKGEHCYGMKDEQGNNTVENLEMETNRKIQRERPQLQ